MIIQRGLLPVNPPSSIRLYLVVIVIVLLPYRSHRDRGLCADLFHILLGISVILSAHAGSDGILVVRLGLFFVALTRHIFVFLRFVDELGIRDEVEVDLAEALMRWRKAKNVEGFW
jgi:hypothetical protein